MEREGENITLVGGINSRLLGKRKLQQWKYSQTHFGADVGAGFALECPPQGSSLPRAPAGALNAVNNESCHFESRHQ